MFRFISRPYYFAASDFSGSCPSNFLLILNYHICISASLSLRVPAARSVRTSHVPIKSTCDAGLNLSVANLSTQPRSLSWGRGPCSTGRRPIRHESSLDLSIMITTVFFLYSQRIGTHLTYSSLLPGLETGNRICGLHTPLAELRNAWRRHKVIMPIFKL